MNLKALILAAGVGSRLGPYTSDKPKCLVEIDDVALLSRQIAMLNKHDINDIVIVAGYLGEQIEKKFPQIRVIYNEQYSKTNMVHTLFCAENEFNSDIIVSYGDIVYSAEILSNLLEAKGDISVVVDMNWKQYWERRMDNVLDDAETLKLTHDNRIIELGQKPMALEDIEGQYIGLMKFTQKGINELRSIYKKAIETNSLCGRAPEKAYLTDLLQAAINNNVAVYATKTRSPWVEVDTVDDLTADVTRERIRTIDSSLS